MPEPDYKDDLIFEPSMASMPRCDIEDLQLKLNIAIEALKMYAKEDNWDNCKKHINQYGAERTFFRACYAENGYLLAQNILEELGVNK